MKFENILKQSDEIINYVLNKCNVYLVTNFKPSYLSCEHGQEYKKHAYNLRWEWLYKNYGYVQEINKFSSEFVRFNEYISFLDYPMVLRHKIFIINSLIENNMHTYTPMHVSIKSRDNKEKIIEIDDLEKNYKNYKAVCHPGFTRGVASAFLNTPLKKVLVYIKKDNNLRLKESNTVKRIRTKKELLPIYESSSTNSRIYHDFKLQSGKIEDSVKFHTPTSTPILKVNNIFNHNYDTVLHTNHYKNHTFEYFNEYCKIIFSNKIKVYTNKGNKIKLTKKLESNTVNLQKEIFGVELDWIDKRFTTQDMNFKADCNKLISPSAVFSTMEDSNYFKIYDEYRKVYSKFIKPSKDKAFIANNNFLGGADIIETDYLDTKKLVEKNNKKGVIIIISEEITSKLDRLFYELLFCLSFKLSIVRTQCKGLQIVNCSHPFWKDNSDYKEGILSEEFLSYE